MYVAPRPLAEDDPNFPIRLAALAVAGFVVGILSQSYMPAVYPSMFVGLAAGARKAFDVKRTLGGPIMFSLTMWVMSFIVSATVNLPLVMVAVAGLLYFLAYYLIQKTGNAFGMLIAVAAMMTTVFGIGSYPVMILLRDTMIHASMAAAVFIPLLYLVFPPATKEAMVEEHKPAHPDRHLTRAAIRAVVLLALSFWLYTVLDSSNMMLAVAAVFVLCFPTRQTLFAEAFERTYATVIGCIGALAILGVLTLVGHVSVLLILVFLAGLALADRMMHGWHAPMVYQFALSVVVSTVGSALMSQEPMYATLTRIILTMGGAVTAAFAVSLLESLILGQPAEPEEEANAPA
jgi:hypothetical protein